MPFRAVRYRYALALGSVAATLAVREALDPLIGDRTPFVVLYFLPVIISARFCGMGPGLLVTVLAALAGDQLSVSPSSDLPMVARVLRLSVFLGVGMLVTNLVVARLHGIDALRASESRYRQMFERNHAVQWVLDPTTRVIVDANPAASTFYGYPIEKLRGMRLEQINTLTPEEISAEMELVRKRLKYVLQFRHRLASGETRDVEIHSSPMDIDGREHLYSIIHDVTDRKRGEEALRSSELHLRQAMTAARMGTWERDLTTDAVTWSENMERLLGQAPGSFEGNFQAYLRCVHPDDRESLVLAVAEAMQKGEPYTIEYRVVQPSGDVRWIAASGDLMRASDGRPLRATGVAMDVTERKRLEDQLRQAQKMEAIGQLAGGIAHDFNNMLSVIMGHAQLLKRELPPGHPSHRHVDLALRAAESSAKLTAQLLAFGRRQVLAPEVVHLNRVVEDTAEMLNHVLGSHVLIELSLSPELGTLRADSRQIQQVIMNLCLNSRDAMPDGGTVTISTRQRSLARPEASPEGIIPAGEWCVLEVADTGCGMTPEVMSRLFEPFFTTKPQGKGTGMGLSTVYGIVTQSGGFVAVASTPGQGSRFTIHLRRLPVQAPETTRVGSPTIAPARPDDRMILLVDDERDLRELGVQVLRGRGYRVVGAASGNEALVVAASIDGGLSLLITDMLMPGMTGRELRDRLVGAQPGLRTLFISGYGGDTGLAQILGEPDTSYMQKPFAIDVFADRVAEMLAKEAAV